MYKGSKTPTQNTNAQKFHTLLQPVALTSAVKSCAGFPELCQPHHPDLHAPSQLFRACCILSISIHNIIVT